MRSGGRELELDNEIYYYRSVMHASTCCRYFVDSIRSRRFQVSVCASVQPHLSSIFRGDKKFTVGACDECRPCSIQYVNLLSGQFSVYIVNEIRSVRVRLRSDLSEPVSSKWTAME